MKIALLGSAPSLTRAPFKNSDYQKWLGGKHEELNRTHGDVPGDFKLWGCSPGAWANAPRADRWFEVHRWEPSQAWFSPEYVQFLRDFKGPVYTGAAVPEIPNHVVYPIDMIEEKFSSYFLSSSLSLMLALAIHEIEAIREARTQHKAGNAAALPMHVDVDELSKDDSDDVIGLWGVDMAASEEYGYQRPGCQFFIIEAMRRGIGVYIPPESDLMRPMPVYGISEWDANYIKLTGRARELNARAQALQNQLNECSRSLPGIQGEMHALDHFVKTWTSPYGMNVGMVIRQVPGTGLGSGVTHLDGRPISRMTIGEPPPVMQAMTEPSDIAQARELVAAINPMPGEHPTVAVRRIISERDAALEQLKKRTKKRRR